MQNIEIGTLIKNSPTWSGREEGWKKSVEMEEKWGKNGYSPNGHIKDVAADRTRDGHVTESLTGDNYRSDQVGNRGASSQERKAHNLVERGRKCFNLQKSYKNSLYDTHFGRNFGSLPGHVRPPDHEIRVGCNPGNRTDEGDSIELLAAWRFRIWQREPQREQDGGHQQIGDTLLARARPGHVQGFGLILNIVVALQCFI